LNPGLYYIQNGGFTVSAKGSVVGSEVTIFMADANSTSTVSITGGGSAQLSPPEDGMLKGITLFFNRSNTAGVTISGGGNLQIYGSLYMAGTTVTLGGNGMMIAGSQIVTQNLSVSGKGYSQVTTAGGLYALPPGCFQ
jgi:hypothetical protein